MVETSVPALLRCPGSLMWWWGEGSVKGKSRGCQDLQLRGPMAEPELGAQNDYWEKLQKEHPQFELSCNEDEGLWT